MRYGAVLFVASKGELSSFWDTERDLSLVKVGISGRVWEGALRAGESAIGQYAIEYGKRAYYNSTHVGWSWVAMKLQRINASLRTFWALTRDRRDRERKGCRVEPEFRSTYIMKFPRYTVVFCIHFFFTKLQLLDPDPSCVVCCEGKYRVISGHLYVIGATKWSRNALMTIHGLYWGRARRSLGCREDSIWWGSALQSCASQDRILARGITEVFPLRSDEYAKALCDYVRLISVLSSFCYPFMLAISLAYTDLIF